jgi:uncharacterized protein
MARKAAKKKAGKPTKRKATKKATGKAVKKRTSSARSPRKSPSKRPAAPPKVRPGTITHTELASADPAATKDWCAKVLGWRFGPSMPTPAGPYHMWRFDNGTGGGLRANNPPEVPGSIPYCEVTDIQATYAKALEAGAQEMLDPQQLPGGMGWIAIVAAPGGVAIGFWGMK